MSFYGVTDIWTYALGAFGIVLLPGPNSLFVLSVAAARGTKAGFQGALGVFAGDTVLLTFTGLGAASLLRTHPGLFLIVKYAGAAYLSWVGLNLFLGAVRQWRLAGQVDVLVPAADAPPPSRDTNGCAQQSAIGAPIQARIGHQLAQPESHFVFALVFCAIH